VSVAGGLETCFARAAEIGAEAIQIFVKNQRQWATRPLGEAGVAAFHAARRAAASVRAVIAHSTYLLNLASPDDAMFDRSVNALVVELERCALLGLDGLVLHPGSSPLGREVAIARICAGLERACAAKLPVPILLETTAGSGTSIGSRVEDLEAIIAGVGASTRRRLGVCIDTCHVFAAGHDIRDPAAYEALVAEVERRVGLERVWAFHLNDSKKGLGSRVDRHANIGEGELGDAPFARLLADPRFRGVPKVVETPPEEDGHRRDLIRLRALASPRPERHRTRFEKKEPRE
jgi:deoxyribonuclease-4